MKTTLFTLVSAFALAGHTAIAQEQISTALSIVHGGVALETAPRVSPELGYRSNLGSGFSVSVSVSAFSAELDLPNQAQQPVKQKRFAGLPIGGGHAGITFRGAIGLKFGLKF